MKDGISINGLVKFLFRLFSNWNLTMKKSYTRTKSHKWLIKLFGDAIL